MEPNLSPRALRAIAALEALEFGRDGGSYSITRDMFVQDLRNAVDVLTGAETFIAAMGGELPHTGHYSTFGTYWCDTYNSPYCELA